MKAADGATGNGDKSEGKDFAGKYRPCAIYEPGERGHVQRGM